MLRESGNVDMAKKEEFYGFLERGTGIPVGLLVEEGPRIGDRRVELAPQDRGNRMYFRAPDLETLRDVLESETHPVDASETRPALGEFDAEDLVPARISITVDIERVSLKAAPPAINAVHSRAVPLAVVRQWVPELAGRLPEASALKLVLGRPEDADVDLVEAIGGSIVLSSGYPRKSVLIAAVPVEERHREMADVGDATVVIVCSAEPDLALPDLASLVEASQTCWDRQTSGPKP